MNYSLGDSESSIERLFREIARIVCCMEPEKQKQSIDVLKENMNGLEEVLLKDD